MSFTKKVENLAHILIWFPRRTNNWMESLSLVMQLYQLRLKSTNDNHHVWTEKTKHLYWPQQHSQHDKHKLSLQGGVLSFEESHAYHSDKVREDILSASTIIRGEKRKIDAQKTIYLLKNLTFMRSMGHTYKIRQSQWVYEICKRQCNEVHAEPFLQRGMKLLKLGWKRKTEH